VKIVAKIIQKIISLIFWDQDIRWSKISKLGDPLDKLAARWTQKNKQTYFGYKNHVKQDGKSKLITKYKVTSAEVHDSNATEPLLDEHDKGEPFYADSAYTGESQEEIIKNIKNNEMDCLFTIGK
jgi:IS5 family transposase